MAELKFKWNALGLGIRGALNKVLTLCLQVFYEICFVSGLLSEASSTSEKDRQLTPLMFEGFEVPLEKNL